MKTKQLKIGDNIEWAKKTPQLASCGRPYPYAPVKDGEGVILEILPRDIRVEMGGSEDWIYLPEMAWVRKVSD